MKQIWIISNRELKSFFDSLIAYFLLIIFVGICGYFTWYSPRNLMVVGQADLRIFFDIAQWLFVIFIPAITMRTIAEERGSGTIELLLTKPVTDWQLVIGKYLSSLLLVAIALGITLVYYITVWNIGPVDHSEVWTGYIGLLLLGSAYVSIGIMCSAITKNQVESFLLSLVISFVFFLIFGLVSMYLSGMFAETLNYLSFRTHFESISRGVIDTKDLVYFISITLLGLIISETLLAKRNYGK